MQRLLAGAALYIVVTFFLFVFMSFLIKPGQQNPPGMDNANTQFTIVRPKEITRTKERKPPKKPEKPKEPPPPAAPNVAQKTKPTATINVDLPRMNVGLATGGLFIGNMGKALSMGDGEAIPLVLIEPPWPRKALREGINGWVKLRFTVMANGSPKDVVIVASKPRRLFDRNVMRSVFKWKFKPRVVDGKAVEQPNMVYTVQFHLDN